MIKDVEMISSLNIVGNAEWHTGRGGSSIRASGARPHQKFYETQLILFCDFFVFIFAKYDFICPA
jgi:hypothetical protein